MTRHHPLSAKNGRSCRVGLTARLAITASRRQRHRLRDTHLQPRRSSAPKRKICVLRHVANVVTEVRVPPSHPFPSLSAFLNDQT